jgi:hypothetical protein
MSSLDPAAKPAGRVQRFDAWFDRRWPHKHQAFAARVVVYIGGGSAIGIAESHVIDAIIDRFR